MEFAELIIRIAEIIGTVAFAISGVVVAIKKELDFLGAIVLGSITAVGGGALRDVLLGMTPPVMFQNYVFITVAIATSSLVFIIEYYKGELLNNKRNNYMQIINIFDAIGLGIFTVVGVNTAITNGHSENWFLVIFIGALTGVGGGIFRDVLAGRVPMVLHKQIYALAATIGATLNYVLFYIGLNITLAMFSGALTVMLIRFLASYYKWNLPKVALNKST
ncbi:trimeric intracellular cation channel family protein [Serpentinicella sp. ANB-PHB4]|uniref:trimeric intracellular cation channel family protein n=1 Tax=Serpentinicella sp. ANB-PHB4 TaxID=3074076 RepID=UPI0028654FAD|nr:trimeric intracellular cation channel family protein [Serpentinicella sp. ANB-PHB4]MDR5658695.1 trimeric intracellular cation channel family protein [Serpentinicella sp. ANB-PHB4]